MRMLKIAKNQKGKRVAMVWSPEPYNAHAVYIESENYQSGLYIKSWGYLKRGLIFTQAEALFKKTIAGRR